MVEYKISNRGAASKEIVFSFTGLTDLRPTWLGERTDMIDAEDEISFDNKLNAVLAKDKNNPWYVQFGSSLPASFSNESGSCAIAERNGLGKNGTLTYSLTIEAKGELIIPIFIAGSYQSEEAFVKLMSH